MDYLKEYKKFITSHYLSQGLRITMGVILPAIALSYFNNLPAGIIVSLGAMSVSLTDNPGPIHHRRNGMIASNLLIFMISLLTGLAAGYPFWLGLLIVMSCFIFSMIGIYGSRATSVGVSALLVMVLSMDRPQQGSQILIHALLILAGGTWYIFLSLLLYSFRPYKLTQQALGECIQSTAQYLRLKAAFYGKAPDYERNYELLAEQQADLHQKQELIRELLFKTRKWVKESTPTSRVMVMIFLDIVDLFERVMTSQQDYKALHQLFDPYEILEEFRKTLIRMAEELDEIGLAVQSAKQTVAGGLLSQQVRNLKEQFLTMRDTHRNADNVEGFISLRQILDNMEDIVDRVNTLHRYTSYDQRLSREFDPEFDYDQFVTHSETDPQLLWQNLNLKSNIFRHSLRVSMATLIGYLISKFLPFGHGYWVLLTIIVILKPAYSLTKKRNYERLGGTIAGALIGVAVLYFVKDKTILLGFLIFFMICTYSLLRIRYLISVLFMTPYILLLFHLLNPSGFQTVLSDRLIDTGIGSAIAFLANIFILPAWEQEQVADYLLQVILSNSGYFNSTAAAFTGQPVSVHEYKLARKKALVSLANLSEAFNRMLSEPARKQKNIRLVHQFVVLNHMLVSHIATLADYAGQTKKQADWEDFTPYIHTIRSLLGQAEATLAQKPWEPENANDREALRNLNDQIQTLTAQRKEELKRGILESPTRRKLSAVKPLADQFNFIIKISSDLLKLGSSL